MVRPARAGRARAALRRLAAHAGAVIAVAALAGFVLGVVGYQAFVPGRRLSEYVYRSLQLFILFIDVNGAPSPTELPIVLDVARFLAPASATAAGIRAVLGLFGQRATRAWVRYFARDHVVVCGLGPLGFRVGAAFHDAGHRVVAMAGARVDGSVHDSRAAGVLVLTGDATDRDELQRAGVARASHLLVASEDDAWNADVTLSARDVVAHRRRGLPCFVHVGQPRLSGLLAEAALGAGGTGQLRLEFFNVWESVPAMVLDDFPPGDHLLVVGAGRLGPALVMHAARRRAAEPAGRRLTATLVGEGAAAAGADLSGRYPRLAEACDLRTFDLAIDSPAFEQAGFLEGPAVTCAYVTGDSDASELAAAVTLARAIPNVPTVVLTSERSGLATLVSGITPDSSTIVVFDVLERACRPEIVLNGTIELLARAIHAAYLRDRRLAPGAGGAGLGEWDELPESTKEANRAQAADAGAKLAAVGCRIQAWTDWDTDGPGFTGAEIERMAELEHERWCRERRAEGWTAGATRDDARKVTPHLVPWAELAEEVKDYDRDAVRALPELLSGAGYEIVRVP